jgi:hypothetical protein
VAEGGGSGESLGCSVTVLLIRDEIGGIVTMPFEPSRACARYARRIDGADAT